MADKKSGVGRAADTAHRYRQLLKTAQRPGHPSHSPENLWKQRIQSGQRAVQPDQGCRWHEHSHALRCTTFDCAAMEIVFHDVPFAAGLKTFDKHKLVDQVCSRVTPRRDLNLVDLSKTALRRLGVQRNELIDAEKDKYPDARKWAEATHAACSDAKGLCWVSRQDDRALAIMLFGNRLAAADLMPTGDPRSMNASILEQGSAGFSPRSADRYDQFACHAGGLHHHYARV